VYAFESRMTHLLFAKYGAAAVCFYYLCLIFLSDSNIIQPTIPLFRGSTIVLIDMPEADVLEILDDTGTFNEQEWIGTGKQECTDLPNFVNLHGKLPGQSMTVSSRWYIYQVLMYWWPTLWLGRRL